MGNELEISLEAIRDLEEIWDNIAKESLANADSFIEQLCHKCIEISELDGIGRTREELISGVLSVPHKRYVVFFRRNQKSVRIIRILHGARDFGSILE